MSTKLNAERRERLGTRQSRRLRSEGRIPVSLRADADRPQVSLSISEEEFLAARRHHEHVFTLTLGGVEQAALVDDLQWDTFGDRIVHVEFRRVDLDKKTEVEVPLEFIGNPKSGLLNHPITVLQVLAKPADIPDSIEVRVEGLEIGAMVLASDLKLPAGVELAEEPDTVVANISAPHEEKAPVEGAEGEGEAGAGSVVAAPKEPKTDS